MDQWIGVVSAAAGATIALLGAGIGIIITRRSAKEAYAQKQEELFLKALDLLTGGTQRRNVGVAAITRFWRLEEYRPLTGSALIGSAIYLLTESNMDAQHELYNLERIMSLLVEPQLVPAKLANGYARLCRTLENVLARKVEISDSKAGLTVDAQQLVVWRDTLSRQLGTTRATDGQLEQALASPQVILTHDQS